MVGGRRRVNRASGGDQRQGGGHGVERRVAGKYCYFPAPLELDVRVSPHPARAFTNAPCGARSLLSVFLARGSVDDSWHASTPSCQPCQNRLDCARYDGGSGSLPLLSAAVDRKPCIVPVVPSIRTRSDCDLRAFGSVANPSVLPGTVPTSDRRD